MTISTATNLGPPPKAAPFYPGAAVLELLISVFTPEMKAQSKEAAASFSQPLGKVQGRESAGRSPQSRSSRRCRREATRAARR